MLKHLMKLLWIINALATYRNIWRRSRHALLSNLIYCKYCNNVISYTSVNCQVRQIHMRILFLKQKFTLHPRISSNIRLKRCDLYRFCATEILRSQEDPSKTVSKPWPIRSLELSLPAPFAPWPIRSLAVLFPRTYSPRSEMAMELSFRWSMTSIRDILIIQL